MLRSLVTLLIVNILSLNFLAISAGDADYRKIVDDARKNLGAQDRAGYRQIVEKVQDKIAATDKKEHKELVEEIKTKIKAEEETAKGLVQEVRQRVAKQDFSQVNNDTSKDISLKKMQKDYQSIVSHEKNQLENGLFILISLSMSEGVLKNLDTLAELVGGRLVLRGFKENSFKKTVEHIQHLQNQGIKVEINPQLFDFFKVSLVPSFILVEEGKVDMLQGNVGLLHVLKEFALSGDNQELAKKYLRVLES